MKQLAIFAKYWEPGQVKTRLAAAIGYREASRLYQAFLTTLLRRFAKSAEQAVLVYTPLERRAEFAHIAGKAWELRPQEEGDLGQRMARYFSAALRAGANRVVLIGSDSPHVPSEYIAQAFDALNESPVVLGPTSDGGYYLVGASGAVPPIFSGVAWSSPAVWSQTLRLLEQAGCPFAVLPEWYDVDQVDDLVRLQDELQVQSPLELPLQELLTAVRIALGRR
ncbi:MAG: TIGR04282 family arsenosugar biosynthesis glycosyltransferase [Planctomycetota bacterium]|nr:TIGR04282 family arsenosugar biosynthesis glycosyltransferase [Planctomycetota bacterium]